MLAKIKFFFVFYTTFIKVRCCAFFCSKKTKRDKSILYIENFPIENAGYQYRAAKWVEILREKGYHVEIWTLWENKVEFERKIAEKPFSKFLLFALKKRFKQVLASRKYETVIVRRELLWFNDYGNLFLDKLLIKLHPNAILDFDDDIAAAKNQPKKVRSLYGKLLFENGNKFNDTLRLYNRFFVASNYLKDKVLQENTVISTDAVCVIPTCVDYDKYPAKVYPEKIDKLTFGWIGNSNNYFNLDLIIPVLKKLSLNYQFRLLVIGGEIYQPDVNFEIDFAPWSLDTELSDLYQIDIGLMPLIYNKTTKGKGGFKLLQYMGLGIPSAASNITINADIINDLNCGFLANTQEDWEKILEKTLQNKINFKEYGQAARKRIEEEFTFNSCLEKYENHINFSI